jgi:hypothetical protein
MKLKNIAAFAHNFTHSYVSFENYVDGEFVFKDLKSLAYEASDKLVSIYWISSGQNELPKYTQRIIKSIEYYNEWLPKLMEQHKVELDSITDLRTDIYVAANHQLEVRSYARDLNGKEYIKSIYEFADLLPYKEN